MPIKIKDFEKRIAKLADKIGLVTAGSNGFYAKVKSAEDFNYNAGLPIQSFKEFLLPKSQQLFSFKADGAKWEFSSGEEAPHLTVLYVKPCELKTITFFDKVFGEPYVDNYYNQRQERLNIIGINCQGDQKGCFCGSMGINLSSSEGSDIFLNIDGDNFKVEIVTEKGKKLAEKLGISDDGKTSEDKLGPKLDSEIPTVGELDEALIKLFNEDNKLWEEMSHSCLSCGVCTFNCSYCYCFDLADEKNSRTRVWDSCQFPKFTQAAGEHNPRKQITSRFRQRILHKFNYLPNNIGEYGCSGCGRCVRQCPMGIDIRRTLISIKKELS